MAIRINPFLQKSAFQDPTKETIQKSIGQLCNEVEKQQVIMPIFQRDLAWRTQKKIELYNFQLNGFAPVAPLSMNRIGPKSLDMPHVTLIDRLDIEAALIERKLGVIDGQQRISTNYQAYINDESIKDIVLDITRGCFIGLNNNPIRKNQIPVGVLYNKKPNIYTDYIRVNPDLAVYDISSLLNQIRTKFFNYFYTINFAQDLSGDDQIQWFDVLNLAGSRVPDVQMKLTRLQIKGLDFYKEYSGIFQEKLEVNGFNLFVQKNTEVSIPLATLNPAFEIITGKPHSLNYSPIPSDAKESAAIDMEPDDLRKCFKMTLAGLDSAMEFIDNNNLANPTRIDYITYLTGYFVYKNGARLTNTERDNMISWYSNVQFANKSNQQRRLLFNDLLKNN